MSLTFYIVGVLIGLAGLSISIWNIRNGKVILGSSVIQEQEVLSFSLLIFLLLSSNISFILLALDPIFESLFAVDLLPDDSSIVGAVKPLASIFTLLQIGYHIFHYVGLLFIKLPDLIKLLLSGGFVLICLYFVLYY